MKMVDDRQTNLRWTAHYGRQKAEGPRRQCTGFCSVAVSGCVLPLQVLRRSPPTLVIIIIIIIIIIMMMMMMMMI